MSGICRIEFSEASNVKVLVEKVRRGEGNVARGRGVFYRYLNILNPGQTMYYMGSQNWWCWDEKVCRVYFTFKLKK